MSVFVLGDVRVGDAATFLRVFRSDGEVKRAQHGCRSSRAFRPHGEDGRVLVLLEWPDLAAFESFRDDPDVAPTMARGSALGPPRFTLLDEL